MDENKNLKPNQNLSGSPVIHTYAGDMAEMVRDHEASVIKIALAEQRRREAEAQKERSEKNKKVGVILLIVAILSIISGIYGFRFIKQKTIEDSIHKEVQTMAPTFILADTQTQIDADSITGKEDISRVLNNEKSVSGKASSIRALLLTKGLGENKKLLNTEDFLGLVQTSMPSVLRRSLDSSIMAGVYTTNNVQPSNHLFFIFKTSDYDRAYAGSLAWETTILDEFFPIFSINISGDGATLLEKRFEDILIENKDARVLKDSSGKPLIYSIFLNRNYYMITDNEDAIKEASRRLRTASAQPL